MDYIPLEQPIAELEQKIDELRRLAASQSINMDTEIQELEERSQKLRREMFDRLSPYEKVQLSRHPRRPNSLELIKNMCTTFVELHGDRNFLDDKAVVGGLATIDEYSIVIIGHQKGRGTKDNIYRNFGMPRPEGYRKGLRLMSMAERFNLPIVTLIDTPALTLGLELKKRGQSEAIAKNIMVMNRLKVPIVSIVIGEGGSGGALALAVANKVHMLEHSVYSVISPEGCASILFKDASKAEQAAEALKLTAQNALKLGIIDSIIKEPEGGAHRSIDLTSMAIKKTIIEELNVLGKIEGKKLRQMRMNKFLQMNFTTEMPVN